MSGELVILGFSSEGGAFKFLRELVPLQRDHLLSFSAASVVIKSEKNRLKFYTGRNVFGQTLMFGSAWGLVAGSLLFDPVLGLLLGGMFGAMAGNVLERAKPIKYELLQDVGTRKLEPGQSALLILVEKITLDKTIRHLRDQDATIIQTSLSSQRERKVRQAWQERKASPIAASSPTETL